MLLNHIDSSVLQTDKTVRSIQIIIALIYLVNAWWKKDLVSWNHNRWQIVLLYKQATIQMNLFVCDVYAARWILIKNNATDTFFHRMLIRTIVWK